MKNLVYTFVGLAPHFRPSRTGGPACLRAAPLLPQPLRRPRPTPRLPLAITRAPARCRAAPRRDRGREIPPRGDPAPASPAARQPRPDIAPTRPPSPAGARALAHSRPRFLSFPPEPRARAPPLAAPTAPLASRSRTTAPFPDSSRPQLRLTFLQLTLALAPPSEPRVSFPAPRHRRPWRRRARPPWDSPFLPFSTLLSCLLAFANASRTSCARLLALPWPEMAAGRWPSCVAAPARAPRQGTLPRLARLSQAVG